MAKPDREEETALTPEVRRTIAMNRAFLAMAPGKQKLDLIFNQPDPKKFVRGLPGEDLYFALKEIGLDDAAEVIGLASPLQFRTFVDLDAWEHDALVPARVLGWMRLALEGKMGTEAFRRQRRALDPELILSVLLECGTVYPLEDGIIPDVIGDNWIRTAEGKYIFDITIDGDDAVVARQLVEDFIDENPFEATRLFEAARWELPAELAESCLRWRTGRLRDLGFPDLEEAIRIWTPVQVDWKPRESAPISGPVSGVPALLLVTSRSPLLLDRVAERLPDEDRPSFNEGLIYLLNCALVADGVDPKDIDLARHALASARDLLSLGLEIASGGDEALATGILATTPAVELFRRAVGELVVLQKEANVLAKRIAFGTGASPNVDSPDAELLTGLRRKRPRLYDPPMAGTKRPEGDWRAFRDAADLTHARTTLKRIEARRALADAAGITATVFQQLADTSGRTTTATTIDQALRTQLVRALLGLETTPGLLSAADVPAIVSTYGKPTLDADASRRWTERTEALVTQVDAKLHDAARALLHAWSKELDEELGGPSRAGELDPQFIEAVLFTAA